MLGNIVLWAVIGIGSLASMFLLDRPWLVVMLGVAMAVIAVRIMSKLAKQETAVSYAPAHQRFEFSCSRLLILSGIVALCGIVLLWQVFSNYDSLPSSRFLVASMIYVPGMVLGLAVQMALWAHKEPVQ